MVLLWDIGEWGQPSGCIRWAKTAAMMVVNGTRTTWFIGSLSCLFVQLACLWRRSAVAAHWMSMPSDFLLPLRGQMSPVSVLT
jgi:hypothetical protein